MCGNCGFPSPPRPVGRARECGRSHGHGIRSHLNFDLLVKAASVQKQPLIGGGTFGGIWESRSHETAEFPGVFTMISVPSRRAHYRIISMYYVIFTYSTSITAKSATIGHFESAGRSRAIALSICFQDCFI